MSDPVTFFEITGPDADALTAFYDKLFGWALQAKIPGWWTTDQAGLAGGVLQRDAALATFYIQVDSVADKLDAVVAAGGRVVLQPIAQGGVTFARFADPAGNVVGLLSGSLDSRD